MSDPRFVWPYPDRTPVAMFEAPTAQPKQRHRTGQAGHMYTPEETVSAEEAIGWAFKRAARRHRLDAVGRYSVAVYVVGASAAADVDNLAKTVMDALQGVVYRNDAQVDELIVRRCVGPGRHVFIAVARLEEATVANPT